MNPTAFSFRHKLVLRLIFACWLITKLACYPLWLSDRPFPMVPVHNVFGYLPTWLFMTILVISSVLMVITIIRPAKLFIVILLALEIFVCLADQNRWQTWEYQFLLMTACIAFIRNEQKAFRTMQLVVAAVYFFAGAHQFYGSFIYEIWNKMILVQTLGIRNTGAMLMRVGYIIPLIEIMLGISLLINIYMRIAISVIYLLHIAVLLAPWLTGYGLIYSSWAWFAMMPLIVSALFKNDEVCAKWSISRQPVFVYVILLLCWVMPWGTIAGKWDRNLSFSMYGGGQQQLYVCTENKFYPYGVTRFIGYGNRVPCKFVVGISAWGRYDLGVPVNAEPRILKVIASDWQRAFGDSSTVFYFYQEGFDRSVIPFKTDN